MTDSPPPPAPAPETPRQSSRAPAARIRRRRRFGWWRWLLGTGVVIVLPAVLLAAALWTLATERGTAWALARVPALEVDQPQGNLLGGLRAKRVVVRFGAGLNDRVVIDDLRAAPLRLALASSPDAWAHLQLATLAATRVSVQLGPRIKPPALPDHLRLPIELEVGALRVDRFELPGLEAQPIRDLRGAVRLGALRGSVHQVDALAFGFGPMQFRGRAQLGAESGLPLQAELDATQGSIPDGGAAASTATAAGAAAAAAAPTELPAWAKALRRDWQARLEANGPLARFETRVALRSKGQRLDATAQIAPLEPWPVPVLDLRTERFDVSALLAQAPLTSLSGEVHITPLHDGAGTLVARVQIANEQSGRWDEHRIPVRKLAMELRARPGAPARFELANAQIQLGAGGRDAGQVQAQGHWNQGSFKLSATLAQLEPHRLDPRLAAFVLSGPIELAGALGAAPRLELKAELDGRLERDPARAVQLRLNASGTPNRIELRQLLARSGTAQLEGSGTARRSAESAPWSLDANARLNEFDPLPWFPGAADSVWRRGPHRFNGEAELALVWPGRISPPQRFTDWLEWLPTLQGQARLVLQRSTLAGVPLQGELSLASHAGTPTKLSARVDAGGNTFLAQCDWTRGEDGRADAWRLDAKVPQLVSLAPLLALAGVPATWATPSGAADFSAQLQGRWPNWRGQGRAGAESLRIAQLGVGRGEIEWTYAGANDAPLDLHLELTDARWAQQLASSLKLDLKGTPNAHALELRAVLNAAPPAWIDALLGPRPADDTLRSTTLLRLDARGGLKPPTVESPAAAPPAWSGQLQRFEVRGSAKDSAPLARLQDLGLDFQLGDAQRATHLTLQPGRGELLGAAIRWERGFWRAAEAAGPPTFELRAELEPLAIAPLLARAQPLFGWGGDLRVGGRINVRSAPSVLADIVLERTGGDLSVTDEAGTQPLQLTDLRVALDAKDGVWNFTQALAGQTLGVAAGAVSARTAPQALWPAADTPIQGVLEARVTKLGTWGAWVPPGWRLAGAIRTGASIGGSFGAPEYTGEIRGSEIGVRNIVQGVNVTDGEIAIRLQGSQARIERFEAKAGNGSLRLEGGASLGEAPRAQLRLIAEKFALLGRVDRRIVTSGNAQLQLDAKSLSLDGKFSVDEGLIDFTRGDAPTLADDVRVTARPGAPEQPVAAAPRTSARKVALNLQVGLGDALRVRGRGLDTQLRGDLRITTPANKLAINGTVRTAQGTYAAYGQKLSIERGELTFIGAAENPRLDIIATRPNLEQTVGVAVTGTALNPRVRLFSEPEMADIDKLSWLVLGRASDGLGRTDTALLQRAAIGLLAGEGTGPTDQLINAIGLDEVSFRQTEGEVRETVVSLGKQLSRRWYVGYERSLNATTGNWQLIYRIAQRLTLRAQSGLDNSLDAIWTWRWQ